jgi:ABC-2 type transport system ATP-binding protein
MERLRAEAPAPVRRLWTSDDLGALEIAHREPHLSARAEDGEGLRVTADTEALDAYVLALGRAGVAVRRLELSLSPLESMFFELTEVPDRDRGHESRPLTGDLRGST